MEAVVQKAIENLNLRIAVQRELDEMYGKVNTKADEMELLRDRLACGALPGRLGKLLDNWQAFVREMNAILVYGENATNEPDVPCPEIQQESRSHRSKKKVKETEPVVEQEYVPVKKETIVLCFGNRQRVIEINPAKKEKEKDGDYSGDTASDCSGADGKHGEGMPDLDDIHMGRVALENDQDVGECDAVDTVLCGDTTVGNGDEDGTRTTGRVGIRALCGERIYTRWDLIPYIANEHPGYGSGTWRSVSLWSRWVRPLLGTWMGLRSSA